MPANKSSPIIINCSFLGSPKYDKIKSIHGSSVGSMIGLIILLNMTWDDLDNYIINRPWKNVFELTPELLIESYENKGVFGKELLIKIF